MSLLQFISQLKCYFLCPAVRELLNVLGKYLDLRIDIQRTVSKDNDELFVSLCILPFVKVDGR